MAASSSAAAGRCTVARFALDRGEEPELVGLYVIDAGWHAARLGFAIGNEFCDHVTERAQLPVPGAFEAAAVRRGAGAAHGRAAARTWKA